MSAYRCERLCLVRIFSYARTSRKVCVIQTEKSSYDESSKTYSIIKYSCGNWTNGSMRGGVNEVTHRCETIQHNSRFFSIAITVQKRGNCSLAHTVVHTADMTNYFSFTNVYGTTDILSVD